MPGQSEEFDAAIPFHPKDIELLPYCVLSLRNNVKGLRRIYVISKDEPEDVDDIVWISEDRFPFTKSDVNDFIDSTNGREGWYLQQLFKMYVFRVIEDILPHVLLFDSDCVVCRPITFFSESGQMLMDTSPPQNHLPYYKHAEQVLGSSFALMDPDICGITDHMLVYRPHMEEILEKIEENHVGDAAWRALLRAVDPAQKDKSGMSEYEIYFNYVFKWHAKEYALRKLERETGTTFRALTDRSKYADIIVFHAWGVDLYKNQLVFSKMGGAT